MSTAEEEIQAMDSLKRLGEPVRWYLLCHECDRRHYEDPVKGWSLVPAVCSCGFDMVRSGRMRHD